jgi:hypothetical protein
MFFILQVIVFVVQVQAFVAGVGHAWGLGTFAALVIGVLICCIPAFGSLILALMTFYGAYAVWDWAWWQAFLLATPGLALTVFALAGGAIITFLGSLVGRRG